MFVKPRASLPRVAVLAATAVLTCALDVRVGAGAAQGGDGPVVQWLDGQHTLPDGQQIMVRGFRFRADSSEPWNSIGSAYTQSGFIPLIRFAASADDSPLVNIVDGVTIDVEEVGPRGLVCRITDRLEIDLPQLADEGDLDPALALHIAPCLLGEADSNGARHAGGGMALADADDKCPDNNCTDWLRDLAEKAVAALRKRSPNLGSDFRRILERNDFRLDKDNSIFPPGVCAVGLMRTPGNLAPPYFIISPECLRNQDRDKSRSDVILRALVLALQTRDRHLKNDNDLTLYILTSILLDYLNDDEDSRLKDFEVFKFYEMMQKVARATGDRKKELQFQLLIESRKYTGPDWPDNWNPPVVNKLKRIMRELRKEMERCENLSPQQREAERQFRELRYARLQLLMQLGHWAQIMAEFALSQQCLDPEQLVCRQASAFGCGNPDTLPCLQENTAGGCQDADCCKSICETDQYCCDVAWDAECVAAAAACYASSPCGADSGDCCTVNDLPGCQDVACCTTVCDADPFCCDSAWDTLCVQQAASLCQLPCEGQVGCGGIASGSCCSFGTGLPGCAQADCCKTVCDFDHVCCEDEWDELCVFWAATLCQETCPGPPGDCFVNEGGSPCVAGTMPFSDDPLCCHAVCDLDSFCCEGLWDQVCVLAAQELCGDLCPAAPACPSEGDCLEPHAAPGCDDPAICQAVCAVDTYCCEFAWDSVCATLANAASLNLCPHFCIPGDLNGDGVVNVSDLLLLLSQWGPCDHPGDCAGDLNGDGVVNVSDMLLLLANWG